MGKDVMFFKALSGCNVEKRFGKGREKKRMDALRGHCDRVRRDGGDSDCGPQCRVKSVGSGLLTRAKPYVLVPLSRVFSTVSQIVALQESISHAEEKASEK